ALMHVLERDVRRVHVQLQSRAVRQARLERPTSNVPSANRDVVALFQVAVDPRSDPHARLRSGAARRSLPRARPHWRVGALATRSAKLLVLRSADVHDHAAVDLLPELQARILPGPDAECRTRSARPRL